MTTPIPNVGDILIVKYLERKLSGDLNTKSSCLLKVLVMGVGKRSKTFSHDLSAKILDKFSPVGVIGYLKWSPTCNYDFYQTDIDWEETFLYHKTGDENYRKLLDLRSI